MSQEKSHPPTTRRRRRARQEGKVAKSQILTRAVVLGGAFGLLSLGAHLSWVRGCLLLKWLLTEGFTEPLASCREVVLGGFLVVTILLGLGAGVGMLIESAQVGLVVEFSPLAPRWNRLEPFAGMRRIVSGFRGAWWHFVILGLAALFFHGFFPHVLVSLGSIEPFDEFEAVVTTAALIKALGWGGIGAALLLGVVDLLRQRRRVYNELAMSLEDIRREQREDEGDPFVRSMRRALQHELSRQERIAQLRRARVVIVERAAGVTSLCR